MSCGSRIPARRRRLKALVERVVNILEAAGKRYAILRFPSSYRERSIDLIAVGGDKADLIIRVKSSSSVSRDEVNDMVKASVALDSVPVIISDDPNLYDNIVYERCGIYLMNERTLENMYMRPSEIVALYRKGELYLSVNRKALEKEMSKRSLSVSEVSYLTNISRRSIYRYRREGGMITIESAEKLVSIVSEDVIESITFEHIASELRDKAREVRLTEYINPKLEKRLLREGAVYDLRKSAPDYLVSGESTKAVVDATSLKRRPVRDVIRKALECVKISDITGINVDVVTSAENNDIIVDELSTTVSLNKVNVEKLNRN